MKIVIIGGGPRGLSALERIVEWARDEHVLQITMFDPYGPGGKIWRETQPLSLMMNTVACQVTLFTDETLSTNGPVAKGPNLYEWAKEYAEDFIEKSPVEQKHCFLLESQNLTPNAHCSRAFYGLYQKWFYAYVQTRMTEQTSVTFFRDTVKAIKKDEEKFQVYTQSVEITADKVIMALGHQENALVGKELELAAYAGEHRLFYSSPKNAADANLEAIKPKAPVIIRGLGLSFFDYLTLLTTGRGGKYEETENGLIYRPSGEEPKIIAGSTRGFPYHPRGENQKEYGVEYQPIFLKMKRLNKLKRKGLLSGELFFGLMKKEVQLVYYNALIDEKYSELDKDLFIKEFVKAKDLEGLLNKYDIFKSDRWDWKLIEEPDRLLTETDSFSKYLEEYLTWILADAKKGNLTGPFSTAVDSLRDLRDEVRFMLDNQLFSKPEDRKWLWKWFTPLNNFLSIGPPLERIAELKALVLAGIVTLVGSQLTIEMQDGYFVSYSKKWPKQKYQAHFLIEARIHGTNNSLSVNPLTQQLIRDGLAGLDNFETEEQQKELSGALSVEPQSNQLINLAGEINEGLFCYGVPTEGIHWLTAAASRPGTNPWTLREADGIAREIFREEKKQEQN
ncbi:FAD/NAD(P)-binding protein [Enterococcus rivorum]|uniref:Oxidoreductase n=1 Tax=Enterococcus rivorum TaxID=762845 RepID=A0A1E5L1A3_9ENTE|nr:FAD/NAD(P)-binding protein [Enterococcus rivorum]MBP2098599.1 hypothetical protein [Enterococcus rivorum]OEH83875.1 oxidoreductase [Enterococcus rivorum]